MDERLTVVQVGNAKVSGAGVGGVLMWQRSMLGGEGESKAYKF